MTPGRVGVGVTSCLGLLPRDGLGLICRENASGAPSPGCSSGRRSWAAESGGDSLGRPYVPKNRY